MRFAFQLATVAVALFAVSMTFAFVPSARPSRENIEEVGGVAVQSRDGRLMEYYEFGASRASSNVSMVLQ